MKAWLFVVLTVVLFGVFSVGAEAISNTAVENPVGSGTVPVTSGGSGLVRSRNPIDMSGNLTVTGNVGGGKHFRGVVPYNAGWEFRGQLGSSSLDSFLRRSASSGLYTGGVAPYYSPSKTISSSQPGVRRVVGSSVLGIGGSESQELYRQPLPRQESLSQSDIEMLNARYRPMSMRAEELQKIISIELTKYSKQARATKREGEVRGEGIEQSGEEQKSEGGKFRGNLERSGEIKVGADVFKGFELTGLEQRGTEGKKQVDVYEQMQAQIEELKESYKQLELRKATWAGPQKVEEGGEKGFVLQQGSGEKSKGALGSKGSPLAGLSDEDIALKARAILSGHKSFASYSDDKFNQHLREAEAYLKDGKYYRAADAYTLASVYKPKDPLAYAGKSHALFAAGEYMSSALFLSRALELFPEYALFKVDIESMVGDRDKLESRVADVEKWVAKSGAGELEFLLGYVYYQMGRLDKAKEHIDGAIVKMPDSAAVAAMKKAIDGAVKSGE